MDGTGLLKHRKWKVEFLETDCNRQIVAYLAGWHFYFYYSFLFLLNFFFLCVCGIPLIIQPLLPFDV